MRAVVRDKHDDLTVLHMGEHADKYNRGIAMDAEGKITHIVFERDYFDRDNAAKLQEAGGFMLKNGMAAYPLEEPLSAAEFKAYADKQRADNATLKAHAITPHADPVVRDIDILLAHPIRQQSLAAADEIIAHVVSGEGKSNNAELKPADCIAVYKHGDKALSGSVAPDVLQALTPSPTLGGNKKDLER